MKKSLCDGPGCGAAPMGRMQVRMNSKKASGGCKCGGKCDDCKAKAKKESEETAADEPDGDRDDSYSRTVVVTDSMTAFRFDQPHCNPGNKVCGGRCIPQEQDCEGALRRKAQGRALGAIGLGAGGYAAAKIGQGITNEGLNSPDTLGYVSKNMGNHLNEVNEADIFKHRKELGKLKGGKKALAGLALTAAAAPLAVGSIVQNVRAFKAAGEANQEKQRKENGYRPNKGRKDSIWASGFENESAESL